MFGQKLKALQYPSYAIFDVKNTSHLRTLVLWLEETKVRCYPIEKRAGLRDVRAKKEVRRVG